MSSLPADAIETCLGIIARAKSQDGFLKDGESEALHKLTAFLQNLVEADGGFLDDFSDDESLNETTREVYRGVAHQYMHTAGEARRGTKMGKSDPARAKLRAKALKRALQAALFTTGIKGAKENELQKELEKIEDWKEFDVFKVDELTKHQPLTAVSQELFARFMLFDKLNLNTDKLMNFLQDVEGSYKDNPYHNNIHAADVTQSLGSILALDSDFRAKVTDLEVLSMLISGIIHDVGHPGCNNEYLVNSQHHLAMTYNDQAVNENMHLSLGFHLLHKPSNFFLESLAAEDYKFVRQSIIAIVLATDMADHKGLMSTFETNCQVFTSDFDKWEGKARTNAMQFLVHVADLANPAKPSKYSGEWSWRVMQEFFTQGDIEKEERLPQNPLRDRESVCTAVSQRAFFQFVCRPMYEALRGLCPKTADIAAKCLAQNIDEWKKIEQQGDQRAVIGRVLA